jgi:hypothetical protein
VLEPVVAKSAILVSDGAQAYRAFANQAGLPHVALNLSAGERTWGIYHIQNVASMAHASPIAAGVPCGESAASPTRMTHLLLRVA